MENPIKMDDLGVPPFEETSIYAMPYPLFDRFCSGNFRLRPHPRRKVRRTHCQRRIEDSAAAARYTSQKCGVTVPLLSWDLPNNPGELKDWLYHAISQ